MDLVQRARDLYAAGRIHDALEAAQAACDRAPKDAEAWRLLARVSRHAGMPAASDDAFRRAAALCGRRRGPPLRVSTKRFQSLVEDARESLSAEVRGPLASIAIRVQPLPTADQIRAGLRPDALTLGQRPVHVLVLFQVNHENECESEAGLSHLIRRSLEAFTKS